MRKVTNHCSSFPIQIVEIAIEIFLSVIWKITDCPSSFKVIKENAVVPKQTESFRGKNRIGKNKQWKEKARKIHKTKKLNEV